MTMPQKLHLHLADMTALAAALSGIVGPALLYLSPAIGLVGTCIGAVASSYAIKYYRKAIRKLDEE